MSIRRFRDHLCNFSASRYCPSSRDTCPVCFLHPFAIMPSTTSHTTRPRANAFSFPPTSSNPQRFAITQLQISHLMYPILTSNLTPEKTRCPGCRAQMCDFYVNGRPHVCDDELECEPAFQMYMCRHMYGQECLLRFLERYGRCPACVGEVRRGMEREAAREAAREARWRGFGGSWRR